MQNITKNLRNLEPIGFARGGFAVVHKAILCPDNSQIDQIVSIPSVLDGIAHSLTIIKVAVKFLDFSKLAIGDGGLTPEKRSQMARVRKTTLIA